MSQENWFPQRRPPGLGCWLTRHFSFGAKAYRLGKLGFPFIVRVRDNNMMGRVRRQTCDALWTNRSRMQRWVLRVAMTIGWPFGAMVEVIRALQTTPPINRPNGVLDLAQRSAHMLSLALLHNVPPGEYVAYRLHIPTRKRWIDGSLYNHERETLMTLLNDRQNANRQDVQDKGRFAELCRTHGLPCIPTLAIFRKGRMEYPEAPYSPTHSSLWCKDLCGAHGHGGSRWRWIDRLYHNDQGQSVDASTLVSQWLTRDCIVQPCLSNHPVLETLSDGSLVDFRIVTGITPDGTVMIIATLAALPCGGTRNRQFILGAVDEDSSRIFSAKLRGFQPIDAHPDNSTTISSVTIPFWHEAIELVKRAHAKAFSRFVFLGWDVAITTNGPLLIETNSGWSAFNHQIAGDEPLGCTPFVDIALQHLEKLKCG